MERDVDARARRAYELAREIEDLREASDVMPTCERMDLLRSIDRKEEELRLLLLQPAPPGLASPSATPPPGPPTSPTDQ